MADNLPESNQADRQFQQYWVIGQALGLTLEQMVSLDLETLHRLVSSKLEELSEKEAVRILEEAARKLWPKK